MALIDRYIESELAAFYPQGEAKALARRLLWHVGGWSLTDLLLHDELPMTSAQRQALDEAVVRLKRYEPVQYIVGEAEFCGVAFEVNPQVLIPRPETAQLVDLVATGVPPAAVVLDIGTGSGCIAVMLGKRLPQASISACDVSLGALCVAQHNAQRQQVAVNFFEMDILQPPDCEEKYDVIVSNPPYVMQCERAAMERNVLDYEPALALFVPDDDPLLFYRHIANFAKGHLREGGRLFFEINRQFGAQMVAMLQQMGFAEVVVVCDMFGNDRFVVAHHCG